MISPEQIVAKLKQHKLFCALDLYADEAGISILCGVSMRTVRAWRAEGKGPPPTNCSPKRIMYDISDLAAWLNQQAQSSE